jgi:hypothetical protein
MYSASQALGGTVADLRDCIVSYIDIMIRIGPLLSNRSRDAVPRMRKMHEAVSRALLLVSVHKEVCLWNDSALIGRLRDRVTEALPCFDEGGLHREADHR